MPTFTIECERSKIANLEPGKSLTAQTRVFWSSYGFAFERAGRHLIDVDIIWGISGVPFGVRGQSDVWVNFPQSDADNRAAATLLPEVGMYVALGGGATHLTEAVSRLDEVFSVSQSAATDRASAVPAAIRGYAGLLAKTGGRGGAAAGSKAPTRAGRARRTTRKNR
jgi:hypothetical protein